MRTSSCSLGFLLVAIFVSCLSAPAEMPSPVSQAWAVRIDGPTNTHLQTAIMGVGPSGDVFFAGQVAHPGINYDLVISRRSPSGALVWEKQYEPMEGTAGNERPFAIAVRGTNVYVAGSITSSNSTSPDFLTLKYRETGELEWAARAEGPGAYNDSANGVAVDGQGNVIVLGRSIGTNGTSDIVVLKYGPTGNLLWTYSYDGPEHGLDRGVGMRVDAAGNIHVAGTSGESSDPSSVVTLKLDPDGHELWVAWETSRAVGGVTVRNLDLDSAGNVVTVGIERSYSVTWKYDANGNRQWVARYRAEEPASMQAVDVQFDGSGNVITAANLYGSRTNDTVLIKYAAADGRQLWATRIADGNASAHLNALDVDNDGNSYLTTSPYSDVITVKVSSDGAQLWMVTYNSQGSFSDTGEHLDVVGSGDIYVSGRSTHFTGSFVSLVKYTQQPVTDLATAVVTPALQVVDPGTDVVFTAEATGTGPFNFQWRMNGRPIFDATNATLALSNVQAFHRGDYSVILSNLAGVTVSPEARLSVRTPPEVVIGPSQTIGYVGTDAAFIASVAGNDFATLQWRHNGTNIPGATNEIFRIAPLSAADGGTYDIVVSTYGGTTTSSAAGLRISRAVELVETTRHHSGMWTWEYAPQLRVLPTGEFLITARSNRVSGSSIVLRKHAANGALLWSAEFESVDFTNAEPASLALDAAGNIYISGLSRQPFVTAALAVLKFNPDGLLLWSRIQTGTELWNAAHAFAVDASGNSTIGTLSQFGTTVTRYNSAGDLRWSNDDPSPDHDTIALAVDSSGNSYLGTTLRVGGYNEIRLRKFDSTGAIAWTRPYTEGMYNRLGAIAVDSTGHLIVVGSGVLPDVPDSLMFVTKYSPAGQMVWETRTGSSWSELASIVAMAIGPGDEITVLTESDDDHPEGERSGVTRVGSNGQFRYRIAEPEILVLRPTQLAVDNFGNAYITGYGVRPATEIDAVTAKYDAYGNRHWLVYHNGSDTSWQYGLGVGADATGDVRVLATADFGSASGANFTVLHYRQRDPESRFRLQLIPGAGGTFHLSTPTEEPFRIEASTDLQSWNAVSEEETQQLLQPGATSFTGSPQRFFRLILEE